MRPIFRPHLVNDPFGDAGLYIDFMFERRAVMFDLGDVAALGTRKLLRLERVFITHAHMDHFAGFDLLLRVGLGRAKRIALYGPPGFADRVGHKLHGYTWNLLDRYAENLVFDVIEAGTVGSTAACRFQSRNAFRREDVPIEGVAGEILCDGGTYRVRYATLDHATPCLAFAIEENSHVNIMKNALKSMGLPVGPWLRALKAAVLRGEPDDKPFRAWWTEDGNAREAWLPLGRIKREALQIVPGQKIAYVVDAAFTPANARAIEALAQDSDILFIETPFLDADVAIAATRNHLTARQAGLLGRRAGAKRIVPFHFSPRYADRAADLSAEALDAFTGADRA